MKESIDFYKVASFQVYLISHCILINFDLNNIYVWVLRTVVCGKSQKLMHFMFTVRASEEALEQEQSLVSSSEPYKLWLG